jgi:D-alanine-D-alanine ligase
MRIGLIRNPRDRIRENYASDFAGRESEDDFLAVKKALEELGHETVVFDAEGELFEQLRGQKDKLDLIFNTCDEGFECNSRLEPHVVSMLEILGIPYTGASYLALGMCLDKGLTKQILMANRIPTPKFIYSSGENTGVKDLRFPLIVKPSREDGSVGIRDDCIVNNQESLLRKVKEIEETYKNPAIVEEFIDGREFNVGIIGNGEPEVLPVSEIEFTGSARICSYDAKWDEKSSAYATTVPKCPPDIPKSLDKKIRKLALKAYKAMGVKGYGRVDFRVAHTNPDKPLVIEVNPNPDITPGAGLSRAAKIAGYSYQDLIRKIIDLVVENKKN